MSTAKLPRSSRKPRPFRVKPRANSTTTAQPSAPCEPRPQRKPPWHQRVWILSALSCSLLWAALPPLSLWPLAWVAPLGWLQLIRREQGLTRRDYAVLWLSGVVYWAVLLYGLTLAHWGNYFGLALLACYLAVYTPLFVGLARVATHRLRAPFIVTAPVVWVAFEYARAYVFTGFSLGLLGHTQVLRTTLVQISDCLGAYGVSILVMFTAACLLCTLPHREKKWNWQYLGLAGTFIGLTYLYGMYRLHVTAPPASQKNLKVALVQGNMDVQFDSNQERSLRRNRECFAWHRDKSVELCRDHPDLQLVVWAESMFTGAFEGYVPDLIVEQSSPGYSPEHLEYAQELFSLKCRDIAAGVNTAARSRAADANIAFIAGDETNLLLGEQIDRYNSALLVDPDGKLADRYYKMHPVMFGEYIPFGQQFPFLYQLSPMGRGLTRGEAAKSFEVAGVRLSPSVCFESTVPQLIRRQVASLTQQGEAPDVLVNLTNDGWFWGSTILDLHFHCSVFRAIENRKPMIIAANTGFSAHIDAHGYIVEQGPRHEAAGIVTTVQTDDRRSIYQAIGDWPVFLCLLATVAVACIGLWAKNPKPTQ